MSCTIDQEGVHPTQQARLVKADVHARSNRCVLSCVDMHILSLAASVHCMCGVLKVRSGESEGECGEHCLLWG